MNSQISNNISQEEEPLIILRYAGFSLSLRIFGILLFVFFLGGAAFLLADEKSTFKLIALRSTFFIALIITVYIVADLLFTDNVRIYKNRAVKTYRIFGDVTFPLSGTNVRFCTYIYGRQLWIAPMKIPRFTNPFTNRITFDCGLARRKDIKKLEEVLQSLGIDTRIRFTE